MTGGDRDPRSATLARVMRQPAHRSFFHARLARRAGGAPVHAWLVEQANLRGFLGAYNAQSLGDQLDPSLSLEELVVGLLSPAAPADGRTLKLVVRILQSGQVDPARLAHRARQERAEPMLHWLLSLVPPVERTPALEQVAARFAQAPRGYRGIDYEYDPQRLVRRPAGKEQLWRAKPR